MGCSPADGVRFERGNPAAGASPGPRPGARKVVKVIPRETVDTKRDISKLRPLEVIPFSKFIEG